jgi:hypothetical protein
VRRPKSLEKVRVCLLQSGGLATLPSMSDEESLNQSLVAEVESMLRDGTVEGLARQLMSSFPGLAAEAESAIGHAVEKLIVRPNGPRDCSAYLAACAYNEMKRLARRCVRHESLEALAERDEDWLDWELADSGPTVEEQALRRVVYDILRSHVAKWETENVQVVTLLYLEAAYEGEPLPSDAASELASELLGYEVDANFVRTWKSRGFKKLREFVATLDAVDVQEEGSLR